MSITSVLAAGGLIRPIRQRGFCPACKGWREGLGDPAGGAARELDPAAVTVLAVLVVAVVAWVLTIRQSQSMAQMDPSMGLGSLPEFATTWVVMMAAMMLPSALPLVYEFARSAEGRKGWLTATAVLGLTYLGVWLLFGLLCYGLYFAANMPWPNQPIVAGLALVLTGVYGLTPLKRASEARCRELCALHGSLPFSLRRGAVLVGARYGLSCLGCSAGLMIAAVLIGMTSLGWMVVITALVLVYKLAPPFTGIYRYAGSLVISSLGVVYIILAQSSAMS